MLTEQDMELEMIDHLCRGNATAKDFVRRVIEYFHAADDLIDEETDAEFRIGVLVMAQDLYCHPFFVANAHALNAVIRGAISTYADSVRWEDSNDPAKRAWADYARHCGLEVLLTVADICGGWSHRREVSREWRRFYLTRMEEENATKTRKGNICPES